MYIKKVQISNIRSISAFEMEFENPAGWHVIIGDNGSGKSSVLKSIALALIGEDQIAGLRLNWNEWLQKKNVSGQIKVIVVRDAAYDLFTINEEIIKLQLGEDITFKVNIYYISNSIYSSYAVETLANLITQYFNFNEPGWFSNGVGPFRRFTGGSAGSQEVFKNESYKKLAAHLSLFGEDVALTEITSWLEKLHTQNLEGKAEGKTLDDLKQLINSKDFLPYQTMLEEVSSEGIFFRDGNGQKVGINQLSDGYRSILSLTFELIRQLLIEYRPDQVFENIRKGEMNIPLPGVVLIDEIDAHLHPTWQTRIGQWFTKYFPNIQFIVTTHSPLICRAAEKGTIWRLAAPGTEQQSGEVTGNDRDRLIYGNVLDAYGTEVFGEKISISTNASEKLQRLGELNIKSVMGDELSDEELNELFELKSIFPTEKIPSVVRR